MTTYEGVDVELHAYVIEGADGNCIAFSIWALDGRVVSYTLKLVHLDREDANTH
jgi:hypothetical protein